MASSGFREEVINVALAELLSNRGIVSTPERIIRSLDEGRRLPDVLVVFQGLRTIIEGKVDDQPEAAKQVLQDAMGRVEQGIAHLGVAVLYPASVRQASSVAALRDQLSRAALRVAICTEAGPQGWTQCDVNYLGELLGRTFDQLVQEDVVQTAVAAIDAGVERIAQAVTSAPATVDRWAEILGIREPGKSEANDDGA